MVAWLIVGYALAIVLLWLWMLVRGDRGGLATLFLFGPRWLCGLPLPLLAVAAAVWCPRMLWALAATALAIVGPIMGFQANLRWHATARPALRVLTCNVDSYSARPNDLADLVEELQPDIVALQEIRADTRFIWPEGWHAVEHNEFILASRWRITEHDHALRTRGDYAAIRYTVHAPEQEIEFFNVHLSTPRPGFAAAIAGARRFDRWGFARLDEELSERASESKQVSEWIARHQGAKIVAGDFNLPSRSTIFRESWSWLADAFATSGWGFGFTKIADAGGWSFGVRIDHVLSSPPWKPRRAWVGPDVGSDHLPLWADFDDR